MAKKFKKLSGSFFEAIRDYPNDSEMDSIRRESKKLFKRKPINSFDLQSVTIQRALRTLRPTWDSHPAELENLQGRLKNQRTKNFKVFYKKDVQTEKMKAILISSFKKKQISPSLTFGMKNNMSPSALLKEYEKFNKIIKEYKACRIVWAEKQILAYGSKKTSLLGKLINHLGLIDRKFGCIEAHNVHNIAYSGKPNKEEILELLKELDKVENSDVLSTETIQQTKSNSRYAVVMFNYVTYPNNKDKLMENLSSNNLEVKTTANCFMGMIKYVQHLEYQADKNQIALLPVSNFSSEKETLVDYHDNKTTVNHLNISSLAQEGLKKQINFNYNILKRKYAKNKTILSQITDKTEEDINDLIKSKHLHENLKLLSCFSELKPWLLSNNNCEDEKQFQSPIIMLELSENDIQEIIEKNDPAHDNYINDLENLIRKKEYLNLQEASQIYSLVEKKILMQLIDELSTKDNYFLSERLNFDSIFKNKSNLNEKNQKTDYLANEAENHIVNIIDQLKKSDILETKISSMTVFVHDGRSNIFFKLISILEEKFQLEKNESEFQFIDNIIFNGVKKLIYSFNAHFCHIKVTCSEGEPAKIMPLKEACKKLAAKEIAEIQIYYHKVTFKDTSFVTGTEINDYVRKTSLDPENKFYFDSFYNIINLYDLNKKENSNKIINLLYSSDKNVHQIPLDKLSNYFTHQTIGKDQESQENNLFFQEYINHLSKDKNTYIKFMKNKFNILKGEDKNYDLHMKELLCFHEKYPMVLKSRSERLKKELLLSSEFFTKFGVYNPLTYFQYESTFTYQRNIADLIKSFDTVKVFNLHELRLKFMLIHLSDTIFFSHSLTSQFWNIHLQNIFTIPHLSKKIFLSQFLNLNCGDLNISVLQQYCIERQPICFSLSLLNLFFKSLHSKYDEIGRKTELDNSDFSEVSKYLGKIEHWVSAIQKSYYQGHCEIYSIRHEKGYYYDCNSLYPFIMSEKEMPVGMPSKWRGQSLTSCFGFLHAKIEIYPDYLKERSLNPILPYKLSNGNSHLFYDQQKKRSLEDHNFSQLHDPLDFTIYPLGRFSGWYFSEELKYAANCGYKIEIDDGYLYNKEKIFADFINEFYKLKYINFEDFQIFFLKHHGLYYSNINLNFFKKELYHLFILIKNHTKLIMNSLYGKVSQHKKYSKATIKHFDMHQNFRLYPYFIEKNEYLINEKYDELLKYVMEFGTSDEGLGVKVDFLSRLNNLDDDELNKIMRQSISFQNGSNLSIGAAITSYARIYMHQNFLTNPNFDHKNVKYIDTDCIMTTEPIPNELIHPTKLGKFKNVVKEFWKEKVSLGQDYSKPSEEISDRYFYYTNLEFMSIRNYGMIVNYQTHDNKLHQEYYIKSYLSHCSPENAKKYYNLLRKCNHCLFYSDTSYISKIINWNHKSFDNYLQLISYYLTHSQNETVTDDIQIKDIMEDYTFYDLRSIKDPNTMDKQFHHFPVRVIPQFLKLQLIILRWAVNRAENSYQTRMNMYNQFFSDSSHRVLKIKVDTEGKKIACNNPLFSEKDQQYLCITNSMNSYLARFIILSNDDLISEIGTTAPYIVTEDDL